MATTKTTRTKPKRRYTSTRRAAQAAQTRADILKAAIECFSESGWSGTTLNAIADRAGVAVETVYATFRSKKQLLREAMDVAIVGDAEPVPLVERPEWAEMTRGNRAQRIAKGIALEAAIHDRSARVWRAIVEAAAADPEIAAFRHELERGRHHDLALGLEIVLGEPVTGPMFEILFVLHGPEAYLSLTESCGLTREDYERAIAEATLRIVG